MSIASDLKKSKVEHPVSLYLSERITQTCKQHVFVSFRNGPQIKNQTVLFHPAHNWYRGRSKQLFQLVELHRKGLQSHRPTGEILFGQGPATDLGVNRHYRKPADIAESGGKTVAKMGSSLVDTLFRHGYHCQGGNFSDCLRFF
jgi:hypothetical protein